MLDPRKKQCIAIDSAIFNCGDPVTSVIDVPP